MPIAAVVQMTSSATVEANLASARTLLERAKAQGASLAVLPENFAIMGRKEVDKLQVSEALGDGPIQSFIADTARELRMWVVAGTMPIRVPNESRVAPASLVFDERGERVARYDKIHLFDVHVAERNEHYRESATFAPGSEPRLVPTPVGKLGMSVCYDIRFPELFRTLQSQGAELFSVPAAFTVPTGQAHWELLLRARAVENLCYVLASAQGGLHENGRETYGHSMIIGPWGDVLATVSGSAPGIAVAEIDLTSQQELRTRFPALSHRRL